MSGQPQGAMVVMNEYSSLPQGWRRYDGNLLTLWMQRYEAEFGEGSALHYAAGLFVKDHRRPIAQWVNTGLNAALLVAPETSPEWPVQRFATFYAPPGRGFVRVQTEAHEWSPRAPRGAPTLQDAFDAAVVQAEQFLYVESMFV